MARRLNILMFSGEYDKALAALILANSAREINLDVTMFFSFWGLCLLRDPEKMTTEDKTAYEKMFGLVAPQGPENLPLSQLNMVGVGKQMLLQMMKDADSPTLPAFLAGARKKGVRFYGCKLSLEVMGLKPEELIPELEIKTAEDYLADALESDIELFI